ncbi:clusterin-associated protein 1 isoform X1 [Solenopsis invicta]|uniref:clusterin-associated protein 1 isoform X1 n=1 Tax=Solenopsis invicta TaxID=13686 RepID=UPI00193DC14E|nr:clusterin-associated protein 1 isoform X1 [Solenopsis invicta]
MSYRDLRNFTEIMRVLGYPRLISIANFRVPNFPLVAEILVWLVKRFEPDVDVFSDHDTEEQRVTLIRSVAEFMALKTNVKLNTKKLYQADGYAVKEMLKIATLLYDAQSSSSAEQNQSSGNQNVVDFDISDKINELKTTRHLASQLTINGATLFDLLGREVELREIRNTKIARQFDTSEIEVALKEVIENTRKEINETKKQIDNVKVNIFICDKTCLLWLLVLKIACLTFTKCLIVIQQHNLSNNKYNLILKETEQNLDARIERRKTELDRNQKRLHTLKKVRPAFMEEFEKLEVELRALYDDYLQKFRYLAYLEHLYEDTAKMEQERFERRQAATKKQLEQMRAEDTNFESMMEGNDSIFATNLQESLVTPLTNPEATAAEKSGQSTIKPTTGRAHSKMQYTQRRIYGSMSGRQRGTIQENESDGSLDSDSDLLIDGDFDDDDDEDLLNSVGATGNYNLKATQEKRSVSKIERHSDDDF